MASVLLIDDDSDMREIISYKLRRTYDVEVTAVPFDSNVALNLCHPDVALVISDVRAQISEGFWVHAFMKRIRPNVPLILFINGDALMRNIPVIDSVLRASIPKPNFDQLYAEVKSVGVLSAHRTH
jgi:DNA-binding NtrC family response regulator